jgi:hypothetical protein
MRRKVIVKNYIKVIFIFSVDPKERREETSGGKITRKFSHSSLLTTSNTWNMAY